MAKPAVSSSSSSWIWFVSVATLIHMCTALSSSSSSSRCYTAIYSFGDSIADTGNYLYYDTDEISPSSSLVLNPPYGETFFHHPTGRFSDGRLIIDFLAEQMGVPLLKPYLGIKKGQIKDWNSLEGVNFAVGGATALDISFFLEKGLYDVVVPTNYSLGVQFDWFLDLLPSICNSSSGCKEVLGRSLFLVGEIGGNDFNYLFLLGTTIEEAMTYVPLVINKISWVINKLIDLGAQTLVVPGNFAIGCNFVYLNSYPSTDMEDYDESGCLKSFNNFAEYYNKQLLAELNRLQELHPDVNIIYADYYHDSLQIYKSPRKFGFTKSILNSCCPLDNANNHNAVMKKCGEQGVITCNDPSQYISWDGIHLTEAAYKWIAKGLLKGPFTNPKIGLSCDSDM
ncbi:hypothetical protein PIB30_040255 [Stylosanthes scabra]|uniref:Uncharacterized protein n=1 Tax=Stylosanthes scabra TaxID=79078 RepID=A0ABU6WEP5_9FABA|nr:hypothetical protein [Stylosanthes scabra]